MAEIKSEIYQIPEGERGSEATLAVISKWAIESSVLPEIILLVRNIISNTREGYSYGKAKAIWEWVTENIKYESDVDSAETLIHPLLMLSEFKSGDCDCESILTASLLLAAGIPTRFVVIGPWGQREHIFCEALLTVEDKDGNPVNKWIKVDTTDRVNPFGVEYTGVKRIFNINKVSENTLKGMQTKALSNLGNDPNWLGVIQKVTGLTTDLQNLKTEGKITDDDISRAIDAISTTVPSREQGTLTAETVKNIPTYCSVIRNTTKVVNFLKQPSTKVTLVVLAFFGTMLIIKKGRRIRRKANYKFQNEMI